MDKAKVAIYSRSTGSEEKLIAQEQRLTALAQQYGEVVAKICDNTVPFPRPGIARIYELAQRGDIDTVVAVSTSRITRSTPDLLAFVNTLAGYGVSVYTFDGILPTSLEFIEKLANAIK